MKTESLQKREKSIRSRVLSPVKMALDALSGRTFLVSPSDVQYLILQYQLYRAGYPEKPKILDGDWDLLKIPVAETRLFLSFKHRFIDGGDWRDTAIFKAPERVHPRILEMGADNYVERYEDLFNRIKLNGYDIGWSSAPIKVHVGRNGELIRHDGWHRLTIAKILNVQKIKVEVFHRHSGIVD